MDGPDFQRQIAFEALLLADYLQTRQIAREPHKEYFERNPLLGRHPSKARINTYFATAGIAHWWISEQLSPTWRERWQLVTIGIEAGVVYQNYKIGLAIRF